MTGGAPSLQRRLLLLVLSLVACVWAVAAALTWADVSRELDEQLDGHLAQAAAVLVVQQTREIDDDEPGVDAPVLHPYAPKVAFQVFHEGRLALRSTNAPTRPMSADGTGFADGFRTVPIDGVPWRVFATHGAERDVRVYVGEQAASRASILQAVLRGTLWPMTLALPLLGLAAWWAVRRGLAPLNLLGRQLRTLAPQSLAPVTVERAPQEMLPMLEALNGLLARIEAMRAAERRFTADAAHELRTPIAAIRVQAQVALAEPDESERRRALQATLQGCDRASRLVEQLLTLARLESATLPSAEAVDLAALARRVAGELAPRALQQGQTIALDAPAAIFVQGQSTLLDVLVRNLLDNAIRYSPPGATVRIAVHDDGTGAQLVVMDSGPGLPQADLARLGERFFRALGSSRSGSGLGFSIVQRIAEVHGATLQARRADAPGEPGGLRVDLRWPGSTGPR